MEPEELIEKAVAAAENTSWKVGDECIAREAARLAYEDAAEDCGRAMDFTTCDILRAKAAALKGDSRD